MAPHSKSSGAGANGSSSTPSEIDTHGEISGPAGHETIPGLPQVRQGDFPAHPLAPGEHYWLHRTGIAGTAPEEVRNSALLAFNGTTSRLLAASTVETRFED